MEQKKQEVEKLLDDQAYPKKWMLLLGVLLLVPGLINFFGFWWTRNGFSVTIAMIFGGYGLPLLIIKVLVDSDILRKSLQNDPISDAVKRNTVIKEAIIGSLIMFGILSAVLVVYCMVSPFGPTSIIVPMPMYGGLKDLIYWSFFIVVWAGVLPVVECYFFFAVQAYCWNLRLKQVFLASFYTWMNFGWILFTVDDMFADISVTALAFLVGVALFNFRDRQNFAQCVGARMAFGCALLVLVLALNLGHPKLFLTPKRFSRGAFVVIQVS
jgi:hypothetical protein